MGQILLTLAASHGQEMQRDAARSWPAVGVPRTPDIHGKADSGCGRIENAAPGGFLIRLRLRRSDA